ncbi:hypothetical protein K488DRAFT_81430 [Vararia minispora EC-137]|uniref:Uncharacterized protein n=1 Tax=Vararia minispora EC-137 TaxID=1314806 RepID=A0ACB8R029_9AGAM|nr:hypothetical protein K488DRAFT_81430 [Vararia minispora EC-137]
MFFASKQTHSGTSSNISSDLFKVSVSLWVTSRRDAPDFGTAYSSIVACSIRDGKPEKTLAKVGPAAKYHEQWRIPDTLQLGQQREDGTIGECGPDHFRSGDFVKVLVQFGVERKIHPTLGDVNVRLQLN